jgi:hypothetical protein
MASIGKSQAAALAEGFLDDIGSTDDISFKPAEIVGELILLAYELVQSAQDNLNATHSNASGRLSDSITAQEPKTAPGFIQIDIEMNFYGQFVNKGVKGTKGGTGLYKFKSDMPGKSMVDAIKKYMKDARSKIGSVKKPIGYESKNATIAAASSAFAMARSIKQHGIHPTYFMDAAIEETDQKVSERLGDALAIDVLNSLPDTLN